MIDNMSINEKIGQMLIVGMEGNKVNDRIRNLIEKYKISGVILYKKNYNNYSEMIEVIKELKTINSKNRVPLFIAIDQEGGRVNRMPPEFHNLYNPLKLSKLKDINIIKESADITGEMLQKSGYNMNFSPVLDILNKQTTDSIGNRCYGKNFDDVSKYGITVMKKLQEHNVVSVIKHFPGQGACKIDSHYLLPSIKKIEDNNIKTFISAIHNGADIMMVGHMIIKNISRIYPASLSRKMIQKIRLKYKFKGVIITDDLKMRAIKYIYGTKGALKKAIFAGNDLVLFRFSKKDEVDAIEMLIELVKNGKIKQRRIDRSVKRIIKLKQKYNITDNTNIEGCNIEEINSRIDSINNRVDKYKV